MPARTLIADHISGTTIDWTRVQISVASDVVVKGDKGDSAPVYVGEEFPPDAPVESVLFKYKGGSLVDFCWHEES